MKILQHHNPYYMNSLLKIKLCGVINKYQNEIYFVLTENDIIYGISRLVSLNPKEYPKMKEQFKNTNTDIDDEKNVFVFAGVWVSEECRGNQYGISLITHRLDVLRKEKNDYIILSDIYNTSPLLSYYNEMLNIININKQEKITYISSARI